MSMIKGHKNPSADLAQLGFRHTQNQYWNFSQAELVEQSLALGEGFLTETGALSIRTGEFTGRSPADKFTVRDAITENAVKWDKMNIAFEPEKFDRLYDRVVEYLNERDVYIKDAVACADPTYRLSLRLVAEKPYSAMFAGNMFIRPSREELLTHEPEWTILCAPGFHADAQRDGTRQHNFAVLNFTRRCIIIGGTGYTGEIKKGIFTVLNFVLPHNRGVFPMHCSANMGKDGDTAVFFGLSGTGKTTLSADPNRGLIGDDEHGWSNEGVFNFEGGCYAKTIDLTVEKEPEIFNAVRFGAILENCGFFEGTRVPDYHDDSITQNTRVSYPIHFIPNALEVSRGGHPQNVFFLTCDAFGVLPPISRLSPAQAMYHFISGYTARVAGTEAGVTDPKPVFSACFGAPFLPLHPAKYAEMLGQKMREHPVNVWLINTGWSGGPFGVGHRMKLSYTRAMITAALNGSLAKAQFDTMPVFGFSIPDSCPGVPSEVLHPRNTWTDKAAFDAQLNKVAKLFIDNFKPFEAGTSQEILDGGPKLA
jgi:phosphoenolpyruvate carboxykinase (ATP)